MLKAKHQPFLQWFFGVYFKWLFRQQFRAFIGTFPLLNKEKSLCWLSNHSSWWDGVWPLMLHSQHSKRRFFVLMLDQELKKRKFLRALGAFSIAPGQREMVLTANYIESLLENPDNSVLLYPQGQIVSAQEQQIVFQQGMLRAACRKNERLEWLFSAFWVEYENQPKAAVYHYHLLKSYQETPQPEQLERDYQAFYKQQLLEHTTLVAKKYRRS